MGNSGGIIFRKVEESQSLVGLGGRGKDQFCGYIARRGGMDFFKVLSGSYKIL